MKMSILIWCFILYNSLKILDIYSAAKCRNLSGEYKHRGVNILRYNSLSYFKPVEWHWPRTHNLLITSWSLFECAIVLGEGTSVAIFVLSWCDLGSWPMYYFQRCKIEVITFRCHFRHFILHFRWWNTVVHRTCQVHSGDSVLAVWIVCCEVSGTKRGGTGSPYRGDSLYLLFIRLLL